MPAIKFLFFLERELHLPLLHNLMKHIHNNKLGEIGVFCQSFIPSSYGNPGYGIREEYLKSNIDVPFSVIGNPYSFKPDITFMADFSYQYTEGMGKIINIGHGTISKGWFFTDRTISLRENCADLLCVPGEVHKSTLSKQVRTNIAVTGMPKLDHVFMNLHKRKEILEKMKLDPDKKTILFAPTFNPEFSIVPHIEERISELIPDYFNVIIKLHGAAPEEWRRRYSTLAHRQSNVFYSEAQDIAECFIAGDLLISDVSSVIYEFSALDKPVLLFDSPTIKNYINYHPDDLEYRYRDIGYRFSDVNRLNEFLNKTLMSPVNPESSKQVANSFVAVRDGSSSEIVVNKALKLLDSESDRNILLAVKTGNDSEKTYFSNKYSSRNDLFFFAFDSDHLNCLQQAQKAANDTDAEIILFCDSEYELSPCIPTFVENHFVMNEEIGIVFPLKNEQTSGDNLYYRNYIDFKQQMHPSTKALQLTYSMTGQSCELEYAKSPVFAVKKDILLKTEFSKDNSQTNWLELILQCARMNKKIICAFDTFIYRAENEINQSQVQEKTNQVSQKQQTGSIPDIPENADIDNKIDYVKDRIAEDPGNTDLIKELINLYYINEDYEMVDVYQEMIPDEPDVLLKSSIALHKQSMTQEAYNKINRIAIDEVHNPSLKAEILNHKASLLIVLERAFEAEHLLKKAMENDPDNDEVHVTYATYYLMFSDVISAENHLNKALKLNQSNINALLGKGIIAESNGLDDEASEYYYRALEINPLFTKALQSLLPISYRIGTFERIEAAIRKFIALQPENIDMKFVLSGILFEKGEFGEAMLLLDEIMDNNPDFEGAKELKKKVIDKL